MNLSRGIFWTVALAATVHFSPAAIMAAAGMANEGEADYRRYLTTERMPEYPLKARQEHLTGSGIVALKINRSGEVTSTSMLKTTGHKILDDAALKACRRFGFIPHTIARAEVPVAFSSSGVWFPAYNTPSDPVALYTPGPDYPSYVKDQNWIGTGTAVIEIDPGSGLVTKAHMPGEHWKPSPG